MKDAILKALREIQDVREILHGSIVYQEKPRALDRYELHIKKDDATGELDLEFVQKPKALVVSGGGGKGIGYAGMVTAMQEDGFIEQLTHVSGASAGAMVASLIAIGMDEADINKIVKDLDIEKLVDSGKWEFRGNGDTFRNGLDIFYMYQINKYLQDLRHSLADSATPEKLAKFNELNLKILNYRNVLMKMHLDFKSVDEIITFFKNTTNFQAFNEELNKGLSSKITFQDLVTLKDLLPAHQKHLIKELTVVVTNKQKQQLEVKNVKQSPNESIANMVQISGAHPALFQEITHEGNSKADGGIIDNMPLQTFLDAGIELKDIVCVCLEPEKTYHKKIEALNNFTSKPLTCFDRTLDMAASQLIGGKVLEGDAKVVEWQIVANFLHNLLIMNTGSIDTLDLGADAEKKNTAIENAKKATKELIANYKKPVDNILKALLLTRGQDLIQSIVQIAEPLTRKQIGASKNLTTILSACHTANEIKKLESTIVRQQKGQDQVSDHSVIMLFQIKALIYSFYPDSPEKAKETFQFYLGKIIALTRSQNYNQDYKYNIQIEHFMGDYTDFNLKNTDGFIAQITDKINEKTYTFEEVLDKVGEVIAQIIILGVFELVVFSIELVLIVVASACELFENEEQKIPPEPLSTKGLQTYSIFHGKNANKPPVVQDKLVEAAPLRGLLEN